jgi:DNA-binding transcriptional MerR regulator
MTTILSTGQLAKLLGIPAYKIGYAHSTGALAEPDSRFLDKRCYTTADIQRVAAHFHINIDDEELKEIECNLQKSTSRSPNSAESSEWTRSRSASG